jgi:hypothetical protein
MEMDLTTVRFVYSPKNNIANIFYQPLFYLAENLKYSNMEYFKLDFPKEQLDKDLKFIRSGIHVNHYQILPLHHEHYKTIIGEKKEPGKEDDKEDDKKDDKEAKQDIKNDGIISYLIDRFQTDRNIRFTYKYHDFTLKVNEVIDKPVCDGGRMDSYTLYTSYQITFNVRSQDKFEEFIQTCIKYSYKFYNKMENDETKITMYLSASEGAYFEYLGKRNKRNLESVYIPAKKKNDIIADLTKFMKPETKARYSKLGINYKRTYLLEGLPGTGKTSLILALASYFNYNIAIVNFSPKLTDVDLIHMLRSLDDKHDDEERNLFIVFEDIDCIFKERKSHDESKNSITFSGLLNALDGIGTRENMITFITTNYKNNLDNALIRPGRIDYIMSFESATREQIIDMYMAFTGSESKEQAAEFFRECSGLNITNITTSLIQQYLMKYIDEPIKAIENIDEMKKIYETSKASKEAGETGLFS